MPSILKNEYVRCCCTADLPRNTGNVSFWPVPAIAGQDNNQIEERQERQVSARTRTFTLCLYNQSLKGRNRPFPDIHLRTFKGKFVVQLVIQMSIR